jgi:hypothetical protein
MKYILPAIIAVVLFSSCTLTKRRYMSGYSIEWRHKAPKTTVESPSPSANTIASIHNTVILPSEPMDATELNKKTTSLIKWRLSNAKPTKAFYSNKKGETYAISSSSRKMTTAPIAAIQQDDKKKPVFFTGDEQEDDYARKSLVCGILSLAIPAIGFLILWGIMLSIGGTLAYPVTYAVVIFAVGCGIGLVFAVLAFINGFTAINEINANPDMYIGKGDAILGMILAALAAITLAAFLLIRYL